MLTPDAFLRLVIDPIRLAVLGAAAAGPVDSESIAADLEVPARRVQRAVGDLRSAGLLDGDFRLDRAVLRQLAGELAQPATADASVTNGDWSSEEVDVLRRFFSGTRLVQIPTHRGKRRIVLDRLAQEFEPGATYPEAEVNFILQRFHPDFASLRRYLVDEEFLTREGGAYWRSGGRVSDEG